MRRRVLVVDDEIELGVVLQDLLEIEGYDVVRCSDAASASAELAENSFDVALLDVFLRDSPAGLDLADRILRECPRTGVVLMTGYADKSEVEKACLAGAYSCIAKPFNLDDIVRVVGMAVGDGQVERAVVDGGRG